MNVKDSLKQIDDEEMTDLFLTAQAFVFFAAGFETSSTTMSHAMYELALNQDIQDKLREEVNATFAENDAKLSYDSVRSMIYLDKVFKESLRKYPAALTLFRKSMNDHSFPGTDISIPRGTCMLIPTYVIHHDPTYYPDPDKFDPERFDKETANGRSRMTFLPFGDGPRNCIGERFAQNQSKVGLAMIIRNFKLEVCERTCKTYIKHEGSPLLAPLDGLYLKLRNI
ncbi:probable cytochrome P450 6a14 [Nasonia vitripennis]|uniref:Cytochrome P450 n=1 Tax=Nasonia vitripennis TaxID=7425 RepID=A0A7M7TBM3_NASVI|nr:probable cytochrome P450 6a14 [Nasonia vitripennis]XP_032451662.1 probable cytochrome P450 6a14 [Nasonia vitripennis]XP_032451663.1 probable cytochrome P450 6a14 [Nasonia vitripennis]XP_032451664.1 probable cytochrome P450 6a14 [Nasonia vitripennis]XP_032451665.1 probable cytochrome P450 6a14 [Nasonia vitripennis]